MERALPRRNSCGSDAALNGGLAQSNGITLAAGRKLDDAFGDQLDRRIGAVNEPKLSKRGIESFG
jgi:hypothetical protein